LFQPALFHDRVDLEYQLSLDEMLIRVWHADVFEYIAAAFLWLLGSTIRMSDVFSAFPPPFC
jgi:hypothetical protein